MSDNKAIIEDFLSHKGMTDEELSHYGVKGMRWGVRRNGETGIRPIAQTLNDSKFGQKANANAEKYMNRQTARAENKANKAAARTPEGRAAATAAKVQTKAKRDSARKELWDNANKYFRAEKSRIIGAEAVVGILTGGAGLGMVTGASVIRSAGYSKGKAVGLTLLGGPLAAVAVVEFEARKASKDS